MSELSHLHGEHHHHHQVSGKSVRLLLLSFVINMLLSAVELIGGVVSGSVALIGDALHNTSDALSILIAVLAFKIGARKASAKYTYGFKRAEVIGGFVNLLLLFISGCYLLVEGVVRLIAPEPIDGLATIGISVLALLIDAATAKISHHDAKHSTNMKMVFIHNLADALGSLGVIVSGFCVLMFDVYRVDGVVALLIAAYMIFQAVKSFPQIVDILMNAAPENITIEDVRQTILQIDGINGVHHIHLWCINEQDVALECHVESCDLDAAEKISRIMQEKFSISHCNIQVERNNCCLQCDL